MPDQQKNSDPFPSELRYDIISKDWVIVAAGRGKRLDAFKQKRQISSITREQCVFCNIESQLKPKLVVAGGLLVESGELPADWSVAVVPNKFPAFSPAKSLKKENEGPFYQRMRAAGFCEVVVTRDHDKPLALMEVSGIKEVIDAYQRRYTRLAEEKFVNYISIFQNHGIEAGASQPHPHSQIITSPLVDADMERAMKNAKKYYKRNGKCISCAMNEWDAKVRSRIVFENDWFLAICPYASKTKFEVIISPKLHLSCFECITEKQKMALAEAFKVVLGKLYRGLNDPAYNFYLHTAPCGGKDCNYYHWHWTIHPKTGSLAGFELGTKMEITTIEPEAAAAYLRDQAV